MSAYGAPITNETLKRMSKYRKKEIGQEERAREATRMIQAESKNIRALNHALSLKKDYGDGHSTLCLIYNATGSRLVLVPELSEDWHGSIYKEQPPSSFENGQWITFLHVHNFGLCGSQGARVYRGTNADGDVCDYLVSWFISYGCNLNSAYTKVGPKGTVKPNVEALESTRRKINTASDRYCKSTVSIGGYSSSEFIAILELKSD
ncbi:hypothetical protein vseg_011367 [Gypsophila vaccaria]